MKRLFVKVKSKAGETISETLVALLISSLALVMLAGMINSTVNLVKTSKTKMNAYYEASAALEIIPASDEKKSTVTIESQSDSMKIEEPVYYQTNTTLGKTVAAYRAAS